LQAAIKKHGIDEDKEVVELAAALKMEQQNELEKKAKENQLSDETMKGITDELAKLPECPEKGRPQVLNFPYWLALFKILNLYSRIE